MLENLIAQSAAILNSDFIAIAMIRDRRIVWANAAMHRLFGYRPSELTEQPVRSLFLDQDCYEAFCRELDSLGAEDGAYTVTLPQKRRDGSTGWYEFNLSGLAGYADIVVSAIIDRTASHLAARRLEASQWRFRSVVEDQTEVISRFLPDGTLVFVNDIYCRLFGKSSEELIGHRWHPNAHPDDLPMIESKLHEMSPENPVVVIENRVNVAGGELRWMQFVNRGLYAADGTLKETQSVGRDITRLKEIESKLRESDERLELALAGSGLVLWDWNIAEQSVTIGNRWFELLGYTNQELGCDETTWMNLINPKDLERVEQNVLAHLQGETASFESEHRLRHKDGHWVTVESKGKVTRRDADHKPLRMVGTILDISQRKRLNEEGMDLLKRIELLIRENTSHSPVKTLEANPAESLTKRQRQILAMIADGMTSAEIGKQLHLATPTVISHRRNLMAKLNLHSTAEMTRFAIDHGLLQKK